MPLDYADPQQMLSRMTHDALDNDLAYYQHLCGGEAEGAHTQITTDLILQDIQNRKIGPKDSWLDVGSGSGYLVWRLSQMGVNATGIEPGGWGKIAAEDKKIKIVQGILTDSTFGNRFDVISATDVVEHQAEPLAFMKMMHQYIIPGGLAYISIPFAESWRVFFLREKWSMLAPPNHCQFFTRKSFTCLFEQAGFSIERFQRYNSSGISGVWRVGVSKRTANRLANALKMGDQALFVLRKSVQ